MELKTASTKAVKFAIMNYHYSKAVPMSQCAFSVFEDGVFCGVICYSIGANKNIASSFGMSQGQACELVRVALNGKQSSTSKAVSISLRLLKKLNPLVKIVVSYADENQGHCGTIYQETNWYYVGDSTTTQTPVINGCRMHAKTVYSKFGTNVMGDLTKMGIDAYYEKDAPKRKYIYPLTNEAKGICERLKKPYPKKQTPAAEALMDDANGIPAVEGVQFDPAAQNLDTT